MDAKELLLGHMEDLAARAAKSGRAASRFLTPAEARSVFERFSRRNDAELSFDGGFADAERVRAVFLSGGTFARNELFTALKIDVPPQEKTPGHRDVLGALMALGVERGVLGDILEDPLCLVCLPELGAYISEALTSVGRARVRVSQISLSRIPEKTETLSLKTDTVASLRLDAVLGAAFGLSRGSAAGLIAAGRVSVDHEVCLQPAKELKETALLSVRGLGRAKLAEVGGMSKKGRIFVKIGLYGR
ncbi:MAG: hypothetical protein LBR85_01300 [Oscillospiraceae bacterium]|jgi:RNA-binding protein YlmH|nr:hypothetical protein [Oscillospiraceae bacterium]